MDFRFSIYTIFLVASLNKLLIMVRTDEIVENTRCLLSVLCSDVLFPRNSVGGWSREGLPPHRLGNKKASISITIISVPLIFTVGQSDWDVGFISSHLKVLFTDAASFTQALHDGFVPQDVLLTEVLSPFSWLQYQTINCIEVSQEVPNSLLYRKQIYFSILSPSDFQPCCTRLKFVPKRSQRVGLYYAAGKQQV